MSKNTNRVEIHGCIVCGKLHNVLVVRTPGGQMVGYTATDHEASPIPGADPPLIACNTHTADEVKAALARHRTGPEKGQDPEED